MRSPNLVDVSNTVLQQINDVRAQVSRLLNSPRDAFGIRTRQVIENGKPKQGRLSVTNTNSRMETNESFAKNVDLTATSSVTTTKPAFQQIWHIITLQAVKESLQRKQFLIEEALALREQTPSTAISKQPMDIGKEVLSNLQLCVKVITILFSNSELELHRRKVVAAAEARAREETEGRAREVAEARAREEAESKKRLTPSVKHDNSFQIVELLNDFQKGLKGLHERWQRNRELQGLTSAKNSDRDQRQKDASVQDQEQEQDTRDGAFSAEEDFAEDITSSAKGTENADVHGDADETTEESSSVSVDLGSEVIESEDESNRTTWNADTLSSDAVEEVVHVFDHLPSAPVDTSSANEHGHLHLEPSASTAPSVVEEEKEEREGREAKVVEIQRLEDAKESIEEEVKSNLSTGANEEVEEEGRAERAVLADIDLPSIQVVASLAEEEVKDEVKEDTLETVSTSSVSRGFGNKRVNQPASEKKRPRRQKKPQKQPETEGSSKRMRSAPPSRTLPQ